MKRLYSIALALGVVSAKAQVKPNIIFVLCDDMGYGDLGCYGQRYISTPNIDNMASEGMLFTQAYAGSPVSAPSRATLMTGQHTGHTWVRGNKEYWNEANKTVAYGENLDYKLVGQEPYRTDHIILPEVMKRYGYTTGMFGKWAGGHEQSESTPDKRSVDEYFGFLCQFQAHAYYPNFLHRYIPRLGDKTLHRVVLEENIGYGMPCTDDYLQRPQYSADLIHAAAMDWIDSQDGETPFCGFFTYTLPHAELAQPEDSILLAYKAKFSDDSSWPGQPYSRYNKVDNVHAQFAAMITRLDTYMGDIFRKLKEKRMDENTIVIFSSDNGPHEEGGADPAFFNRDGLLRGLKRSCHEGGIRVPFIVRWRGRIAEGSRNDHILAFYDVMPTLMEIIGHGEDFPEKLRSGDDDVFDGVSFAPTLLGDDDRQKDHDYLYWEFHETQQVAVRKGDWKLVMKDGKYHLYNLRDDIHEDHDIAASYPQIVDEMKGIIKREHTESDVDSFRFPIPE